MAAMPLFLSQKKPHFFRIFFPDHHGSQLKIPVEFIKYISSKNHQMASLVGPSQSIWSVELVMDDNGMFFRTGWSEFVVDHCLRENEFLLFRYDGDLHFTVKIFDESACEKENALHASPCQDLAIIGDTQTLKKSLVSVVEDLCASPCRDYIQINSETAGENHVSEAENGCPVEMPVRNDGERSNVANPSSMPYWYKPCSFDDSKKMGALNRSTHSDSSYKKPGRPKKSNISKDLIQVNFSTMKEIVSVSDNDTDDLQQELVIKEEPVEFELPGLQQAPFLSVRDENDMDVPVDVFTKKSLNSKKRMIAESSQLTQSQKIRHKMISTDRQVSVKSRIGTLVSHRRPVTPDEVRKAYESASSFTSKNPSVLVVMRESYVYRGFFLSLPRAFVKDHLPNYSRRITLWSPTGEPWEVNYVSFRGYGGLSARWSAFALAHNLEVGDACVFELFRQNEMRVHIFRVVEEITPLTNLPTQLCQA